MMLTLFLSACSGSGDGVSITGSYEGMDQADFLIYTTDGGNCDVDTLHLRKGNFEYSTHISNPTVEIATYYILYPNMQQLPVWASTGDRIKVKGSALDLQRVAVTGNIANELYTDFRCQLADNPTDSLSLSRQFIAENPGSPVATYIMQRYLVAQAVSNPKMVDSLLSRMVEAQPLNPALTDLSRTVQSIKRTAVGGRLPQFDVTDIDGNRHRTADYRGRKLLVTFWANWRGSSMAANYSVRRSVNEVNKDEEKVQVLSFNLDPDTLMCRSGMRSSHVTWPVVCDHLSWHSPDVQKFGVHNLPYFILYSPQGRVIASGTYFERDIKDHLK